MNVKDFAGRVGISPHTVRYYESVGLLRDVRRLPNGHRYFSDRDIEWISFVQRLKETGMPLAKIRQYAELRAKGDSTLRVRQSLLEDHARWLEDKLTAQQRHLLTLNEKIDWYRSLKTSAS